MSNPLFVFFDKMNAGNYDYVDQLNEEDVASLSPYVLLMWVNGAASNPAIHVMLTDIYCNQYVFSLAKHPRLLLKLFVAANCDIDTSRYKFDKAEGRRSSASKDTKAIASFYQCTLKDAEGYATFLSQADVKEIHERIRDEDNQ